MTASGQTWTPRAVGDFCLEVSSVDPARTPEQEVAYIDIAAIDRQTKVITAPQRLLGVDAPSRARQLVRTDDVLVSTVRPNLNAVAQVPDELNGQIASTGFCVLRPDRDRLHPKLVYYWVQMPEFVQGLMSKVRGANYPAVRDVDVFDSHITFPDDPTEQARIVELLDCANALRRKRIDADAKLVQLLDAIFRHYFGDLQSNTHGFNPEPFEKVAPDTKNGLYKHADFFGRGTRILKMFNLQDGGWDLRRVDLVELDSSELQTYKLDEGDILLNRVNSPELVGKCAVVTRDLAGAVFESKNIRIRVNRAITTPEFLWFYLSSDVGRSALVQGMKHAIGMATINGSDLRGLHVPMPPLELQQKWAIHCQLVQRLQTQATVSAAKLETLFQIVLHRAFTGELTAKWREAHLREGVQEMSRATRS